MSAVNEVSTLRREFVSRWVTALVNECGGHFTGEEYESWGAEAKRAWAEKFPALAEMPAVDALVESIMEHRTGVRS